MFIQSHCQFHCSLPFIVTFCLIHVITSLNPPSITSTSPQSFNNYTTATRQHGHLQIIPLSFFLVSSHRKSHCLYPKSYFLLLILLSGDIHLNPGPTSQFKICTLNIRSLTNQLHYTALADLALTHNINLFALSETWVTPSTTFSELSEATPPEFSLISTPRPVSPTNQKKKIVGGGTAFLIHNSSTIVSTSSEIFKSFELSSITIKLLKSKLTVFNIYRNHYQTNTSTHDPVPFSDFLIDFQTFISTAATTPHEFLITGDFNIHTDNHSDLHSQQFLSLLKNANLNQHVNFPTHQAGHTLDLVITTKDSTLSPTITHSLVSPSDHFPIFTSLVISPPSPPPLTKHFFRCIKSINLNNFIRDIRTSRLITQPPTNLSDLVECYNLTLSNILNKHAPMKSKLLRPKPSNPWFTPALQKLKSTRRHLEKIWSRTHSTFDLNLLKSATNHYHASIIKAKKLYNSTLLSSNLTNPKKLWNTINKLLHRIAKPTFPSSFNLDSLPQSFATFFSDKIQKLRSSIVSGTTTSSPHQPPVFKPPELSFFHPATIAEVSALLSSSPDTSCDLDPIPTSLLKQCKSVLLPTITNIINLSLSTGIFPDQFKNCSVHPLLKKSNLDKENLSNYRPISHLSYLSKLTERLVKNRLVDHLNENNLMNSFQSAYTKFNSTETTLLAVHDHIIRAMSQQQVTGLCLLDLSAAFDTIDHTILLHRLKSWFGLTDTVLSWIQSYLSSRSFTVDINGIKSPPSKLLYGVPQGSVLGPLLFILYTTPLSSIISQSSVNHKLYADDTQLFLSFSADTFSENILLLQNTISNISSWMASNFLSLNPAKTEFLLIGLPAQLSKIHNPKLTISSNTSIQPVSSARNLGIIFDSNLSFSDHISYISKSCFSHIRDLRHIRNTLDHKTACTIATSLIHSKLDYCNSLFLNISNQQLNRLQLVLNSAARAVTKTPKFHHITPHLKSLHWLKITQRIQYKILSLTYKSLQYNKPSSISDLLTIQPTRSTRSSAVVTLQRPSNPSRLKISDRSFYFQAPALWNALPHHLRSHSSQSDSLLSLSSSQFHKQLKTHLFLHSYPP